MSARLTDIDTGVFRRGSTSRTTPIRFVVRMAESKPLMFSHGICWTFCSTRLPPASTVYTSRRADTRERKLSSEKDGNAVG